MGLYLSTGWDTKILYLLYGMLSSGVFTFNIIVEIVEFKVYQSDRLNAKSIDLRLVL